MRNHTKPRPMGESLNGIYFVVFIIVKILKNANLFLLFFDSWLSPLFTVLGFGMEGRCPKDRGIFLSVFGVLSRLAGQAVPKPLTRLFPQLSWKSRGKRALSKNFSVILSVCWFTNDDGESLHPILLDSFGIFIIVISMQSDKWKIFRLFRAVFLYFYL